MVEIKVYPIIISKEQKEYYVSIPDFESTTQGRSSAEAEKAGINYSRILQDALMKVLGGIKIYIKEEAMPSRNKNSLVRQPRGKQTVFGM